MRAAHLPKFLCTMAVVTSAAAAFPAQYSFGFIQPEAPLINAEYSANIMQVSYSERRVKLKYPLKYVWSRSTNMILMYPTSLLGRFIRALRIRKFASIVLVCVIMFLIDKIFTHLFYRRGMKGCLPRLYSTLQIQLPKALLRIPFSLTVGPSPKTLNAATIMEFLYSRCSSSEKMALFTLGSCKIKCTDTSLPGKSYTVALYPRTSVSKFNCNISYFSLAYENTFNVWLFCTWWSQDIYDNYGGTVPRKNICRREQRFRSVSNFFP